MIFGKSFLIRDLFSSFQLATDHDGDANKSENMSTKRKEAAKEKADVAAAKKAEIEARRIEIEGGLASKTMKHSKPKSGGAHRSNVFENGIDLIYTSDDVQVKHWFFCTICKKVIDADVSKGNAKLRRHLDKHPEPVEQVILSIPKDSLIDAIIELLNAALRLNASLSKEALDTSIGKEWKKSTFVESARIEMMKNSKRPTIRLSSEGINNPLPKTSSTLTITPPRSPDQNANSIELNEPSNTEQVETESEIIDVEKSGLGCESVVICRKRAKAMPTIAEVETKKKKVESTTDPSTDISIQVQASDDTVHPIPTKDRRRKPKDTVADVPMKKSKIETLNVVVKKRNLRSNSVL